MASTALRIDSERTRRQILRSARELCREAGYDSIRMADVAERVGCARATVYNHFPNREVLLDALCAEYLGGYLEIFARIEAWAGPDHTVFEVLRETVAEELRWRVANGDLRQALDRARRQHREFYVEGEGRIDEAMLAWFGAIHEGSLAADLLRPNVDTPFATRAIYAMIDHVVGGFPVDTTPAGVDRAADAVARLQWHAIYVGDPNDAPLFTELGVRAADVAMMHQPTSTESRPGTSDRSNRSAASGSTDASKPAAAAT